MIYTDELPQTSLPIPVLTIREVLAKLPESLPWPLNVWISGKITQFGITTEGLVFLAEMKEEPSVEQRSFFGGLFAPWSATLIEDWKDQKYKAERIYNEGRLRVDKGTMTYRELPTPVYEAPVMTVEELKGKLPKEIPFPHKLYLTGGLVKNGWTANDVDFLAPEVEDRSEHAKMARFFSEKLGWKTDVGQKAMPEREPIFTYKNPIYVGGICQLP
jgi:hypothetical protein